MARHPAVGPLWWLCSRVLVAPDPMVEGLAASAELADDPTDGVLAAFLPDESRLLIVGWPPTVVPALARRGDLDVLAADDGTGVDVGRALGRVDIPVVDVTTQAVGAAAATVDIVILEASVAGPTSAVCAPGSRAAAAVARAAGRTVWLVTPVGRVLPGPTYDACLAGAVDPDEPWESDLDVVPLDLVDRIVGVDGPVDVATGVRTPGCPVAPELLVKSRTPGSHRA
ncbi:MAG TPA: hypothetical protein VGO60_11520 [Iamia sp.]|nr:hypothetical protein [Iamia sp.]